VTIQTDQDSTFIYNYELYCGSINFVLTPDYDTTNSVYKIYFSYNGTYTWSTDTMTGFTPYNTFIRPNTTLTTYTTNSIITSITGIPSSFVAFSNNASYYGDPSPSTTDFISFNQPVVTNYINTSTLEASDIQCVDVTTNILSANTLSVNSITTNLTRCVANPNTYTPCWLIDTNINGYFLESMRPLLASCKALASNDDGFVVYPGYKLVIYRYANYIILSGQSPWSGTDDFTRQTRTIDNTNGTSPVIYSSSSLYGTANQVQSCRIYYGTTEISLNFLS
jgi:hypothetical protein